MENWFPFKQFSHDFYMGGKIEDTSVASADMIDEYCENYHIDYPIINHTFSPDEISNRELSVEVMRAFNQIMLEEWLDDYDYFRGLAHITTKDPDKAAEEIDRIGQEDQVVGVYFGTLSPRWAVGDPRYDPIYQAIQDNDLIAFYHADNPIRAIPRYDEMWQTYFETETLYHPIAQMTSLTSLIVHGTPEKFPEINFVFVECGLGWIPYMMYRLNKRYHMRRSEAPLLQKTPEEYIRESFYFGTQPIGEPNNPEDIMRFVELIGVDNLMYASDYAHWDWDAPDAMSDLLQRMDEADREKILELNAKKAFKL